MAAAYVAKISGVLRIENGKLGHVILWRQIGEGTVTGPFQAGDKITVSVATETFKQTWEKQDGAGNEVGLTADELFRDGKVAAVTLTAVNLQPPGVVPGPGPVPPRWIRFASSVSSELGNVTVAVVVTPTAGGPSNSTKPDVADLELYQD